MPILSTADGAVQWEESNAQAWEFGPDAQSATRYGQFAGNREVDFTKALCGYTRLNPDGSFSRSVPERHPKFSQLYARRVRYSRETGEPTNAGPSASLAFLRVEAAVDYETVPYTVLPDFPKPQGIDFFQEVWRYVSRVETFAVESVLVPGGAFQFAGTTVDVPEVPARVVPSFTAFMTWHEVPCEYSSSTFNLPRVPTKIAGRIEALLGKINSATFLDYPPRTLLLINAEPTFRRMHDGNWCVDVKYTIAGRGRSDLSTQDAANTATTAPSWVRLLRKDNKFWKIVNKDTGGLPYEEGDYLNLFMTGP